MIFYTNYRALHTVTAYNLYMFIKKFSINILCARAFSYDPQIFYDPSDHKCITMQDC